MMQFTNPSMWLLHLFAQVEGNKTFPCSGFPVHLGIPEHNGNKLPTADPGQSDHYKDRLFNIQYILTQKGGLSGLLAALLYTIDRLDHFQMNVAYNHAMRL